MPETAEYGDAELVARSLSGDREAFGQIVSRYKTLVCSVTYSAMGSLGASEDLAQETFVTAWKRLGQLREPPKLRFWLCGIARGLISNAIRRQGQEPAHGAEPLDAAREVPAPEPLPSERAISQEEEAILWRSLERIPEGYREPLVLFYREHQSIGNVAQALELSEDAVKQRLSRGRRLLHEQVLAFVEGALERSNPGSGFTVGVMGALGLLATPAKAATVGAVTAGAQGSSAAKGAGILGTIGLAATSLGAVMGNIFAIWGRIRNARSARERTFLARASWGFLAWAVLFLVGFDWVARLNDNVVRINNMRDALLWSSVWIGVFGIWVAYSIWMTRRQRRIQMEEGTLATAPGNELIGREPTRRGFKATVYGGLAAMIFGPGGLLVALVRHQGDRVIAGLLAVLAVVAWLVCAGAILRRPQRIKAVFVTVWWGLALVILATLNMRWHVWLRKVSADGPWLPPFYLDFLIVVFFGSIGLAWWLERHFAGTRKLKRDAVVAVVAFVALLVLGLALRRVCA